MTMHALVFDGSAALDAAAQPGMLKVLLEPVPYPCSSAAPG
jgi:hypothetical protein